MEFFGALKRDVQYLLTSTSIKEAITEIKDTAISDTVSFIPYGETVRIIIKSIHDVPSMIFWSKMERFLRQLDVLTYDERQKFSQRFVGDEYQSFTSRLITLINEIDTDEKVDIIANLTRALAQEQIEHNLYFRLVHCTQNTLYEDLLYLKNNTRKKEISYDISIFSLVQTGLAYQSVIDGNGDNKYDLTSLGIELVLYGIEYDRMDENHDLRMLLVEAPTRVENVNPEWTVLE